VEGVEKECPKASLGFSLQEWVLFARNPRAPSGGHFTSEIYVPQPFPDHLLPNVQIDTAAVLEKRLTCTARGMEAIAQHSMAEGMVSNVLIAMLHADPAPAAAIYGVIRNGKLQRDALMAIAQEVLDAPDRKLFDKVLGLLQSSARGRDQLAHSLWGVDDQFKEEVILVRPDKVWRFSAQEKALNSKGGPSVDEAVQMQKDMREACTVWTAQDIFDVRTRGVRAMTGLIAFSNLVKATDVAEREEHRATITTLLAQSTVAPGAGKAN